MFRKFLAVAIVLGLVGIGSIIAFQHNESHDEIIRVRFPIPIIENGQAPFYLAADRGFYKDAGLVVTFGMGSPDLNPVKMVATGQDDIGVLGGPDTLLVARARGTPLTAVAILHRNANFSVVLALQDSPIKTVQDLDGKRVGFFYGHISTDVLRSFFRRADIKVEEVDVGFDYTPLLTGRVDAEWAFTVTAGLDLPQKGHPVRIISPQSVGINTHGYTIFTRDSFLREHRDAVKRFVSATLRGAKVAVEDPQAAVDALLKRNPDLDPDLTLKRQLAYNEVTTHGPEFYYGYMDLQMFTETSERLISENVIPNPIEVHESFDDTIVKEIDLR